MDNYIGKLLDDRYEILEIIGTGGMAVVYKALCHRLNRLVAIKILKDELSRDAEFRRRFHGESQAVAMLSHPNIVSVYDVSHWGETDYIVMELIDGITLKQYMQQKGMLNWREVLHFATQIAKALDHAHSRNIVHRDIKPHNIMLLKDGSVKVADFGIARITSSQSTLTREALGSVHYISPEQARGSRVDNRSDLYSLGVVMYEMETGRPPFEGESPVAVAIQHINATPVAPCELNDTIPKGLEQITMHAMTANIDNRYASATEMLQDFDEFRKNPNALFSFGMVQATAGTTTHVQTPTPVRQQPTLKTDTIAERKEKKNNNGVAIFAGILCLALVIGGIFYFLYSYFFKDVFETTQNYVVPSLVGKMYDDIADMTDYPGFVLEEPNWVYDDTYPAGQIMNQSPNADLEVKEGTAITLTISSGQNMIKMPILTSETVEKATAFLEDMDMNFLIKTQEMFHDTVESGKVISTDPVDGTNLKEGQTITLVVSIGQKPAQIPVPALMGKNIDDALQELTALGLTAGSVNETTREDVEKGTVVYQSVAQDTLVKEGYVINLLFASGPPEVPEEVPEEETPPEETDPEVDPDAPEEPPVDTGFVTKQVQIPLPTSGTSVKCRMYLDRNPYGEEFEIILDGQEYLAVDIKGTGTQELTVFFDGINQYSEILEFVE